MLPCSAAAKFIFIFAYRSIKILNASLNHSFKGRSKLFASLQLYALNEGMQHKYFRSALYKLGNQDSPLRALRVICSSLRDTYRFPSERGSNSLPWLLQSFNVCLRCFCLSPASCLKLSTYVIHFIPSEASGSCTPYNKRAVKLFAQGLITLQPFYLPWLHFQRHRTASNAKGLHPFQNQFFLRKNMIFIPALQPFSCRFPYYF